MKVRDVMNRNVVVVSPKASIKEAASLMISNDVGCLIVMDKDAMVGIITDRDMIEQVVMENMDSSKTKVKDVMKTEVIMIDEDKSIDDAVKTMIETGVKKLPVISGDRLVGIITAIDICAVQPKMLKSLESLFSIRKNAHEYAG